MTWFLLNPLARRARRSTPRRQARGTRPARFRPRLDCLEDRVVLSTIHWTNPAGGAWGLAANWDSHSVPGAGDDVVIDVPGNITITHDTGTDTVRSLVSQQNLILTGTSSLTVTGSFMESSGRELIARASARFSVNGATTTTGADLTTSGGTISLTGPATITGGHLTALGGVISLTGAATLTSTNLAAENGGMVSLPGATVYNGAGSVSLTVRATGAGSRVDLSNVTQWRGAGSAANSSWVSVEALDGGSVDLRQVAQFATGNSRFLAQGAGSEINLSALTSFTGARNDANILEADTGATITAPSLTNLDGVTLRLSGNGTLPTAHVSTFQNGNVFLDNSARLALPSVTGFNGTGNRSLTVQADHGSQLDLSAVTQWQGAGSATNTSTVLVQALNGSSVDLSRITQLSVGNSSFQSSGTGSQINLTGLTGFTGARGDASLLEADTGGGITAPNLAGLNAVDLRVSGPGTLPTGHISTFLGGDIYLTNQASLALPLVTGFNGSGIHTLTLQADQGSRLDLSAVTQWQGAGDAGNRATVLVQALNGGTVDLSRVAQITAGNTSFRASGVGSQIVLTALTNFTGARTDSSSLEASAGGRITAANLTSLNDVTLKVTGSGTLPTAHVSTLQNSDLAVDSNGSLTLPSVTRFDGSGSRPLTVQADHGGRLDLSAVTQWQGAGDSDDSSAVLVQALNGGVVDLSRVAQITAGNTSFRASGVGSQIVLTALTGFTGARTDGSSLEASSGGTLTAPNLTGLNDITLRVSDTGTLPTGQLTSLLNSNVLVDNNGSLALPLLTSFDGTGARSLILQADHGGHLDLSHVTQWQGAGGTGDPSAVMVAALNGGTVDVSRLATIAVGNTSFRAEGSGSRINLAALTSFTAARADAGFVQADTNGTITLGSGTTTVTMTAILVDNGGTVAGGTIQLAVGSTLSGSGTVQANLINGALVDTGQDGDALLVTGTYQQTTGILNGLGPLTVNGLLTWQGGTMTDPGQTTAAGGLALSGSAVKILDGRSLNDAGAGAWTGGDLDIGDGAVFTILAPGSLDAQSNQVVLNTLGGDALFVNAGLFRRSAGVGTTTIAVPFANPGTLQVQAGTGLDLTDPFTSIDGTALDEGAYFISGTFQIVNPSIVTNSGAIVLDGPAAGIINQSGGDVLARLNENAGSLTVQNGRRFTTAGGFSNDGTLIVGVGSTLTVSGAYAQTGTLTVLNGGSANLNGGGAVDGIVSDAGALTIAAGTTLTIIGSYTELGTLTVPDTATLSVAGTFTNLADDGTLSGGTYQIAGNLQLSAALVTNAATIVLDGPDAQVTDLSGDDLLAGLSANSGGLTIQNGASITTAGDFSNDGTLTVGGGSSLTVSGAYTQTNTLTILAGGSANLNGGGTADGLVCDAGALTIGTGTTFIIVGTYTELGTLTVPDPAALIVTGAFTNLADDGTLNGGTYQIAGTLQLSGAIVTNAATLVLDGPDSQILDETGNDALAAFTLNADTGTFIIQNGRNFTTAGDFTNLGHLTLGVGSPFTVSGDFTQGATATLEVQLGGAPDTGQFGLLSVTGTANLDGALQVTLTNGYVPISGDAFQILTYATRGDSMTFANPPDGFDLDFDDVGGSLTIVAQ